MKPLWRLILFGVLAGMFIAAMFSRLSIGNMPFGLAVLNILLFFVMFCLPFIPILILIALVTAFSRKSASGIGDDYQDEGRPGLAKSFRESLRAAKRGDSSAQFETGLMYEKGQGVKQDFAEAYFWLSLSGSLSLRERGLKAHLSSGQMAEVEKRVAAWKRGAFTCRKNKFLPHLDRRNLKRVLSLLFVSLLLFVTLAQTAPTETPPVAASNGYLALFLFYLLIYYPYIIAFDLILLVAGFILYLSGFLSDLPKGLSKPLQITGIIIVVMTVIPPAALAVDHYGHKYGFISYPDGSRAPLPRWISRWPH